MTDDATSIDVMDPWYRGIGEFVVKFETLCLQTRQLLELLMPGAKTHLNQQITITVLARLEAMQLVEALGAVLERRGVMNDNAKAALKDFKGLVERRNVLVHSPWFAYATDEPAMLWGVNMKRSGNVWKPQRVTIEELRRDIDSIAHVQKGLGEVWLLAS